MAGKVAEVAGLRAAMKAHADVLAKRDGIGDRLALARGEAERCARQRAAGVVLVTAGGDLPPSDMHGLDDALRRANGEVELLTEALAAAEVEVTAAAAAEAALVTVEGRRRVEALHAAYEAAGREVAEARGRQSAAYEVYQLAERIGVRHDPVFQAMLAAHAP